MYRVVIDARSAVAARSGIGAYAEALIRHMVPLAGDMRFLVIRHPARSAELVRSERVEHMEFAGETKSLHTVLSLGRRHDFRDYDLYHSPADIVPRGLNCPWVVTLHDLMWVEKPHLAASYAPVRIVNSAWYRLNFAHAISGARRIIAISRATADAISRVYPHAAHKVRVVHHGVDHAYFAAGAAGPRSRLDKWIPPEKRYSLIVGQGSPYKNHDGMICAFLEATRSDSDHMLVLVRRFRRRDSKMRRLLARPDARKKVVVLPFVSDEDLRALLTHARMLLFASHYEGFGMPALEAMSLGTPVLASNAAALVEVTADAALQPDPTNQRELEQSIALLDTDEALRARLIAAGRRRAGDFSWDACASATLAVYREAIAAGKAG